MTGARRTAIVLTPAVILLVLAEPAWADNCSSLTDCYGSVASGAAAAAAVAVILGMTFWWPASDPCEELRAECEAKRAEAAAAQAEAAALRAAADRLTAQGQERLKNARGALERFDAEEKSWMEGAGGRLEGVRLTAYELRRLREEERMVRDRHARREISTAERERLLARWGDETYVREQAAKWKQERAAERERLEQDVRQAEAGAAPAGEELDKAGAAAREAEARAAALKAQADAACQKAAECDEGLPPPPLRRPERDRLSGTASGAGASEGI